MWVNTTVIIKSHAAAAAAAWFSEALCGVKVQFPLVVSVTSRYYCDCAIGKLHLYRCYSIYERMKFIFRMQVGKIYMGFIFV